MFPTNIFLNKFFLDFYQKKCHRKGLSVRMYIVCEKINTFFKR